MDTIPQTVLNSVTGRDLVVEPGPKSGPINFLAYPLLEVNGIPVKGENLNLVLNEVNKVSHLNTQLLDRC